jgi:hypothetical protein
MWNPRLPLAPGIISQFVENSVILHMGGTTGLVGMIMNSIIQVSVVSQYRAQYVCDISGSHDGKYEDDSLLGYRGT